MVRHCHINTSNKMSHHILIIPHHIIQHHPISNSTNIPTPPPTNPPSPLYGPSASEADAGHATFIQFQSLACPAINSRCIKCTRTNYKMWELHIQQTLYQLLFVYYHQMELQYQSLHQLQRLQHKQQLIESLLHSHHILILQVHHHHHLHIECQDIMII